MNANQRVVLYTGAPKKKSGVLPKSRYSWTSTVLVEQQEYPYKLGWFPNDQRAWVEDSVWLAAPDRKILLEPMASYSTQSGLNANSWSDVDMYMMGFSREENSPHMSFPGLAVMSLAEDVPGKGWKMSVRCKLLAAALTPPEGSVTPYPGEGSPEFEFLRIFNPTTGSNHMVIEMFHYSSGTMAFAIKHGDLTYLSNSFPNVVETGEYMDITITRERRTVSMQISRVSTGEILTDTGSISIPDYTDGVQPVFDMFYQRPEVSQPYYGRAVYLKHVIINRIY